MESLAKFFTAFHATLTVNNSSSQVIKILGGRRTSFFALEGLLKLLQGPTEMIDFSYKSLGTLWSVLKRLNDIIQLASESDRLGDVPTRQDHYFAMENGSWSIGGIEAKAREHDAIKHKPIVWWPQ